MALRKVYFIVLDGAADRPLKELHGQTPLEAAYKPWLNALAKKASLSMIRIISDDIPPESDSGVMALLGYDPLRYYCGRGTLECLGAVSREHMSADQYSDYKGYPFYAGFRINFGSSNSEKKFLERRVCRSLSNDELQELTGEIRKHIKLGKFPDIAFDINTFGRYRGSLCFYSDCVELSGNVENTDPGFRKNGFFSLPVADYFPEIRNCRPMDNKPASVLTAHLVNEFSTQCIKILRNSSVNQRRKKEGKAMADCILVRDGGTRPHEMEPFFQKYGRRLSVYGQLSSEKAITEMIGGIFNYSKAFDQQLSEVFLADCAHRMLKDASDVVFCHLKGPDEPGHDGNPQKKTEAIQKIDRFFSVSFALI